MRKVCKMFYGPMWLNELGRWIEQLIQAYDQNGVRSHPTL